MDAYRIVGTAGHIDHGKSALVRALTGVDPDRLKEEKERGITIDLGFADTRLADGTRVAFIDVPGHERFVKNMLAGIGGIDAVLLVVAADESVMPQTREHFAICELLDVRRGVVAVTKSDLVDEDLVELVELEVRELLADGALAGAAVVPTSAVDGRGLDELRAALGACLEGAGGRATDGLLRLPVDRVFTVRGFGTVVTGTLLSGQVAVGDSVHVLPSGRDATVRGVQVHGDSAERALAGQRTALNLHGVRVDEVQRGDVLAIPGSIEPTHLIDARLEMLPEHGPLEHLQRTRFHHGAAEILCRVATLEGREIAGGASGLAQLRLERPHVVFPGDRFVLRRYSPMTTLGGGTVIDPLPVKHRGRDRQAVALLERLEAGDATTRAVIWASAAGTAGIEISALARRLGSPRDRAAGLVGQAVTDGELRVVRQDPLLVVATAEMERVLQRIVTRLTAYHIEHPLHPGAPKEKLRGELGSRCPTPVYEAALAALAGADRIRVERDVVALADHAVRLSADLERARDQLVEMYRGAALAPPDLGKALAAAGIDEAQAREIHHHLVREGALVMVKTDLAFHAEALRGLVHDMASRFEQGAEFSVADFKDWAGISRKHAIPLLEHLDAQRVTRRVGDRRIRV